MTTQIAGVTVVTKANVYFDGNVVSYTVILPSGERKTLGFIRPGSYHFSTGAAEGMIITAGACRVTVDGSASANDYGAGSDFEVPGKSGFMIEVAGAPCEYICSFLS
jgi:uncharacterized protein YaiE (UPF0345 family)